MTSASLSLTLEGADAKRAARFLRRVMRGPRPGGRVCARWRGRRFVYRAPARMRAVWSRVDREEAPRP